VSSLSGSRAVAHDVRETHAQRHERGLDLPDVIYLMVRRLTRFERMQ
jgi:hypothetical protein